MRIARSIVLVVCLARGGAAWAADAVEQIDNGTVTVRIDRDKGGAVVWLSWRGHPGNAVNVHDPGRLIQQSYYAGRAIDRRPEGQHAAWSPWPWNPIQAGGVASWASMTRLERAADGGLVGETAPKLWDMPDEDAEAVIRQVIRLEEGFDNVVALEGEIECRRHDGDRWGPPVARHQELPACYLTRSFATVKTYRGDGRWQEERIPAGRPWARVRPSRSTLACFDAAGEGVAIISPAATEAWNVGPHGEGASDDSSADPCMHVAPVATASLGPRSAFHFRCWLVVGDERAITAAIDKLAVGDGSE